MDQKTVLILGGYGNTGKPLARLLLQESDAKLVLAGRNLEKAMQASDELNLVFSGSRVRACYADASDTASMKQALAGIDLVVVASPTSQYTRQVAASALEAGIGYLDILFSPEKTRYLQSIQGEILQAGCCFITDGGFHPGLPAFLVRYVGQYFDDLASARVGSVIKEDWKTLDIGEETVAELVELINDFEMVIFKNGRWMNVGLFNTSDYIRMDFGGAFGRQYCAPMMLDEMRFLPAIFPGLQETGFYVGSFNWFVDWVIMPVVMVAVKLWPQASIKPMARWMHWGLKVFSRPPYGTLLKVEARGMKNGQAEKMHIIISHPDGYMFTAIPVAACLLQYLDGSINKPGLWFQALLVEPGRFMQDMQRMGIMVKTMIGGKDEVGP